VTRRLARLAVGLYPLAFRRRYGEEMRALLDDTPPSLAAVLDLMRGGLAAHVHPPAATDALLTPADRVRASASGQLACWVLFAAAGFGFYKTTEDAPFRAAGHEFPLLGDAHASVVVLAIVASAAVLLGALPLVVAALSLARREQGLRLLLSRPGSAAVLFVALTGGLVLLAHSQHSHPTTTVGASAFIVWGLAGLACGAVCLVASRRALFAMPLPSGRILAAFACGAVVTAAMTAIALATALYATALLLDAPHLAGASNGPFQLISTELSLIAQVLAMLLAATLASIATLRGWRTAGELRASRES